MFVLSAELTAAVGSMVVGAAGACVRSQITRTARVVQAETRTFRNK
jgi:hypothetical protein